MNLNFSANMAGFCRDSHILQISSKQSTDEMDGDL